MSKTRILSIMAGFLLLAGAGDAAESKPSWQDEWEKILQAAKKEGQVTIYISGYDAVLPDFRKDYPDIKVVAVTGRGDLGSLPGDARTGGESARSYRCRTRFKSRMSMRLDFLRTMNLERQAERNANTRTK